jgi:hypothetical protein
MKLRFFLLLLDEPDFERKFAMIELVVSQLLQTQAG